MATTRTLVRKNGIPVRRFWNQKITQKGRDEHYITTYPVFLGGMGMERWSMEDEKAPRTLEAAVEAARALVESPEQPQTSATIYEMRAVYRVGTEFDYKLYDTERRMQHEREAAAKAANDAQRFQLVRTTADSKGE